MDLVAAVLNRFGGVPIADLVVRYCPTLFLTIDILAVFCLAHRLIGSRGAAAVAAMLATLGEDSSFIPGLLQNSDQLWIVHYFAAPTIVSLYVNPMVMAHGLLFASLFCLQRSIADPRWGWAIAAALCCAALVQTKVFVFVQLSAAVGIAVAINFAVFRRWAFLKEWLATALISAPLVFYTIQANTRGAQISWTWSSGIESYVQNAFRAASWPLLVTYPIAGLIVYLALAFGFRIVGIGELIKSFRLSRIHSIHLLLAVFVIPRRTRRADPAGTLNDPLAREFGVGPNLNRAMRAVLRMEHRWRCAGLRLPIGGSRVIVAQKRA
jgi:hypothetical protein